MNKSFYILLIVSAIVVVSCKSKHSQHSENSFDINNYTDEDLDYLGITDRNHLSEASKRALQWPKLGNEWFIEYEV